ncbi:hypothetical protein [Rodentibacter haemolyticus]|uniref:Uncharacterized protein n=1 Tax=Rodentibacter haemolyticus TaxID=2778911 RepID=A0ABX6UYA3_9PAST|nr:hypothetical protein [Rodentibacter haemolyticus]QPB43090.1 hypothetical protein IHV77_02960 [Rodentibacter haemolyticus]
MKSNLSLSESMYLWEVYCDFTNSNKSKFSRSLPPPKNKKRNVIYGYDIDYLDFEVMQTISQLEMVGSKQLGDY